MGLSTSRFLTLFISMMVPQNTSSFHSLRAASNQIAFIQFSEAKFRKVKAKPRLGSDRLQRKLNFVPLKKSQVNYEAEKVGGLLARLLPLLLFSKTATVWIVRPPLPENVATGCFKNRFGLN